MSKKIVILQSNYIPWKGYFDLIFNCDEFVFLDNVQYTKNDWRNRNKIKTANGIRWLTIPVCYKFHEKPRISEMIISDKNWADRHWSILFESYRDAEYFSSYRDAVLSVYEQAKNFTHLSEINHFFLKSICNILNLNRKFSVSTDYFTNEDLDQLSATHKLKAICMKAQAEIYISGPTARGYLEESVLTDAKIKINYADYSDYQNYKQVHPPFEQAVSILDLIFNVGPECLNYLKREKLLT